MPVHHLVLTDGSKGSWDPDADLGAPWWAPGWRSAARLRSSSPAAVSRGGGDRVHFLGSVDGELLNGPTERREVARVIRTVRPNVVLGHDPWRRYRLHPDHRAAGFLTLDALVAARDPHFVPELGLTPHRPTALLLWEADLPNHVEHTDGSGAPGRSRRCCATTASTRAPWGSPGPVRCGRPADADDGACSPHGSPAARPARCGGRPRRRRGVPPHRP